MDLSVIVPIYNEVKSLPELVDWIIRTCAEKNISFEVFLIDDGSTDGTWEEIERLAKEDPVIKGIKFRRNYGKSAALQKGFEYASGSVVIQMDSDLQDSPDEIPSLYDMIREQGFDLVSGWKKKRHDPVTKTIPSKLYNWTARKVSGIKLHDFNCGLKAYRKDVVKNIEVYGEMHRYIPVLAKQSGFINLGEKVVQHQERKYGATKFGPDRFIKGFLDLISITFISRFGKKPMHLFGALGTMMFILGFGAALFLGIRKLIFLSRHIPAPLVAQSPYFYIALTAMIIGTQLFLAGFLGELISRSSPDRNVYQVDKTLNT